LREPDRPLRHVTIDGMRLACLDEAGVVDHIADALAERRGGWVVTANVDHLLHLRNPASAYLYEEADLVVADGMPLLWAARLQGTPLPGRVAGSDLIWSIPARAAAEGHSIYLLGGAPGTAARAASRLLEAYPALRIAGLASPLVSDPATPNELAEIRRELERTAPEIVFLALGSPKQEKAIAALRDCLPASWWIGVGAGFSFVGGDLRRAPVWLQRIGLEWLHRLLQEPRRLGARYLRRNLPYAVGLLVRSAALRLRGQRGASGQTSSAPGAQTREPPCEERLRGRAVAALHVLLHQVAAAQGERHCTRRIATLQGGDRPAIPAVGHSANGAVIEVTVGVAKRQDWPVEALFEESLRAGDLVLEPGLVALWQQWVGHGVGADLVRPTPQLTQRLPARHALPVRHDRPSAQALDAPNQRGTRGWRELFGGLHGCLHRRGLRGEFCHPGDAEFLEDVPHLRGSFDEPPLKRPSQTVVPEQITALDSFAGHEEGGAHAEAREHRGRVAWVVAQRVVEGNRQPGQRPPLATAPGVGGLGQWGTREMALEVAKEPRQTLRRDGKPRQRIDGALFRGQDAVKRDDGEPVPRTLRTREARAVQQRGQRIPEACPKRPARHGARTVEFIAPGSNVRAIL
jgi:N-acetylglucosaminyldiphosphoundecaprenol N-acetyl-beta-D-mannosaminyltransferase